MAVGACLSSAVVEKSPGKESLTRQV